MSISTVSPAPHPVVSFAARLEAVLDTLTETPVWSMTTDEQADTLVRLTRAVSRVAELRLRVLAQSDTSDVAAVTSATSTGAWLAQATRQSRSAAHADVRLATTLERRHTALRAALAEGRVSLEQTRVIVRALEQLPESVDDATRELAEKHMLDLAADHNATELKLLGRRVFEVVDPDAADAEEGRRLAQEEAAAAAKTSLSMFDNGDGTHSGRFKIPDLHAAMLRKALEAFLNPHRPDKPPARSRPRTSRPEQLGQAFCRLLERLPADRLPTTAGCFATVVVLLDYDKLCSGLGAAHLDTGTPISASEARRLACEAGIVPAVYRRALGGPSVILDLGRRSRLHTEAQRLALTIRDGGCTTEGCDRPPAWCHAHHEIAWADGGVTSVENGRLLCPFHHRKAHNHRYELTRLLDGKVAFHRRP